MKNTLLASCTPEQKIMLDMNLHLIPIDMLEDGDLLVLDAVSLIRLRFNENLPQFGPYVLMTDGCIQTINFHYLYNHGLTNRHLKEGQAEYLGAPQQLPFSDLIDSQFSHPNLAKAPRVRRHKVEELQAQIRQLSDEINQVLYTSRHADLPFK